jgi:hypothetical protein
MSLIRYLKFIINNSSFTAVLYNEEFRPAEFTHQAPD